MHSICGLKAIKVNNSLLVIELIDLIEGVPRSIKVNLLFYVLQLLIAQGLCVILTRFQICVIGLLVQRFTHSCHVPRDLTVTILSFSTTGFHTFERAVRGPLDCRMLGAHRHVLGHILRAPKISWIRGILFDLYRIMVGSCDNMLINIQGLLSGAILS
jgi:hypothetical protein